MQSNLRIFALLCSGWIGLAGLAGCGEAKQPPSPAPVASVAPRAEQADRQTSGLAAPAVSKAADPSAQRHIAVRQFLVIEVPTDALQPAQQSAVSRCRPPVCEVLESTFKGPTQYETGRATVRVRIVPGQLAGFVDEAARGGEITEQRTETEDKTDQVIDTDARLRNLTELRERMRTLLKSSGAKLQDIIEIERELARVQAELESALGQRKLLAAETERTTLSVEWRARRSLAEAGTFSVIKRAFADSGRTLAESLAALITFIVAVLPWALLLGIGIQLLRLWWRARRKRTDDQ